MSEGYEQLLTIPNYILAARFSRIKSKRGGTCILVKKGHNCKEISDIAKCSISGVFECCGIELVNYKTIVICIYRVPKSNNLNIFFEQFDKMLHILLALKQKRNVIIAGDFNIDCLKHNNTLLELECLLLNYNLKLQLKQPTRLASGTCIDNFAHNIGKKCKSEVIEFSLSDHTAQLLKFPVNKIYLINKWKITRRDFNTEHLEKFRNYLKNLSFSEAYESNDANKAYNSFMDDFMLLYKLCFPHTTINIQVFKKPKWLSRGIKNCSKKKRELLWNYRLKSNDINKLKFKKYNKLYKKIIKLTQRAQNCYKIKTSTNKSKTTWDIINKNKTNIPKDIIDSLKIDNKYVNNPQEIANSFNNFFVDKIQPINSSNSNTNIKINKCNNSIFMAPSTPQDVLKIIKDLKNTNSVGHDEVSTKVLKYVADIICVHLSFIINLCISTGTYPDKLKISIIKPLFKKDDKESMNCYRPIALLSIFSKIFEKYIYEQIYNFLERHNILTHEQKGFRRSKTINMAIFDFLKNIYNKVDTKVPICAVYCDMTQAFDYVSHDILLNKLEAYGIRGNVLKLMESYLKNRTQYTEITRININKKCEETFNSHNRKVMFGVPQGSVLGPLLFIIYINDLPLVTKYPITLFADDSTVTVDSKGNASHEDEINKTIQSLIQWMNNNNLKINIAKTKIMYFSQRIETPNFKISYQGTLLDTVATAKFLGIIIDKNMNWKTHTEELTKRVSSSAYALYRLSAIIDTDAIITAYHGIVESVLRFGVIFWGNSTNKEIVFKSQKRCIRAMFGLQSTDSCKQYFIKFKILTLPSLFIYEVAVFVKANPKLFSRLADVSNRSRRDGDKLCIVPCNTALMHKSVFCLAPVIFNKIPKSIQQLPLNKFKLQLKKFLISKCFYNLTEYLIDA